MQFQVEQIGQVVVATVISAQLDASNADDFKNDIAPILAGTSKLVLDLNRVRFVDSSGCGVILSCLKHLTARNGDLKLCQVAKPVRTIFDLIRLHRICQIVDTQAEAVNAFRS